ncbi:MAG TPA: HAD family hydrolase [Chloroflexota bacterium]
MQAVLFDLYDTLVYVDAPVIEQARREQARLAGAPEDAFFAQWRASTPERMTGVLATLEAQIEAVLRACSCPPTPALLRRLVAVEEEAWRRAVHLYDDALPTLEALRRRGYSLGLVSNCSSQAGTAVHRLGLDRWFDAVALSYQVGVMKPDPGIFLAACRQIEVEPRRCVFVADGAFNELDAARQLGMVTVLVEQDRQSKLYGTSAAWDHRVTALRDVLDLLPRTAGR